MSWKLLVSLALAWWIIVAKSVTTKNTFCNFGQCCCTLCWVRWSTLLKDCLWQRIRAFQKFLQRTLHITYTTSFRAPHQTIFCRVRFHYTDLKKDFRWRLEEAHRLPPHQLPGTFKERSANSDPPGCILCDREERACGGRIQSVLRRCSHFRALASACYHECYAADAAKSGPHWWRGGRMYSFAWIAADVLGVIKARQSGC